VEHIVVVVVVVVVVEVVVGQSEEYQTQFPEEHEPVPQSDEIQTQAFLYGPLEEP